MQSGELAARLDDEVYFVFFEIEKVLQSSGRVTRVGDDNVAEDGERGYRREKTGGEC